MNIADGVRINSWRFPNKEAVVCGDKRLTYTQLNADVNKLAHALLAKGFKRGDKVAVIMENVFECLVIYNAAARIGVISVPVNFRLTPKEKAYIVNNSDSIGMFVEDKFIADLEAAKADIPQIRSDACFLRAAPKHRLTTLLMKNLLKACLMMSLTLTSMKTISSISAILPGQPASPKAL